MEKFLEKLDWPMTREIFEGTTKVLFWVLTLLVGVIAYQGKEVLQSINDHEVRLTSIEASRYTTENARRDEIEFRAEMREFITLHIAPINSALSEIKQAVKDNRDARIKQ